MPVVATVLDDFTRADEGPPPSASWTGKVLSTDTDGYKVVSNQAAQSAADATVCADYWNAATFGPDCEAWIVMPVIYATSGRVVEIYVRLANPGAVGTTDGYRIRSTSPNPFQMSRIDNDVATTLGASVSGGTNLQAGDTMTFSGQGSSLTMTVERSGAEVWVMTRFDATYTAAGFFGVRSNDSTQRLSSFGGGTFPALAAPTLILNQGNRW